MSAAGKCNMLLQAACRSLRRLVGYVDHFKGIQRIETNAIRLKKEKSVFPETYRCLSRCTIQHFRFMFVRLYLSALVRDGNISRTLHTTE